MGVRWDVELDTELVADAVRFLRGAALGVKPRVRWPSGIDELRGVIPAELRLSPGWALSMYGDGGWGNVVKAAKYGDHRYADVLVDASASLLRACDAGPASAWVTSVPSTSSLQLVADFARRLAAALSLEYRDVVRWSRSGRPQKEMENSAQQFGNVYGAFEVHGPVRPDPVLLVDDIVDSGWTITTIGIALREAGAGPVFPFVLAKAVSS